MVWFPGNCSIENVSGAALGTLSHKKSLPLHPQGKTGGCDGERSPAAACLVVRGLHQPLEIAMIPLYRVHTL